MKVLVRAVRPVLGLQPAQDACTLAAVPAPLRDSVVKQLLEPAVLFAEMDLYET